MLAVSQTLQRFSVGDVGVGQVFLLRDVGHGEMVLDQKYDQLGICRAQAVRAAELGELILICTVRAGTQCRSARQAHEPAEAR